ncbi:hypothetical protein DHEL01_v212971 [Diaporthe helianthi]|uniref:Uncharacterized protein n=1 Tax=Diaporthe helianthi TaxID=158607 RepID=A0A2P5HEE9_DIAHE|nr:hypothetical protein DHEL01_v212971 [Diaporthe helianthi]
MFRWYEKASVCFAYLSDVSSPDSAEENGSEFRASKWFTRGWTLQEAAHPTVPRRQAPAKTAQAQNGSPPHGHGSPNQPVRVAPSPSPPKPAKWHPVAPVCGAWLVGPALPIPPCGPAPIRSGGEFYDRKLKEGRNGALLEKMPLIRHVRTAGNCGRSASSASFELGGSAL